MKKNILNKAHIINILEINTLLLSLSLSISMTVK